MFNPAETVTQSPSELAEVSVGRRTLLAVGVGAAGALLLDACGDRHPGATPGNEPVPHADAAPSPAASTSPEVQRSHEQDQMIFVGMPTTAAEAAAQASSVATRLKGVAASGKKPFVVMEPTAASGDMIDLHNVSADVLSAFFSGLKKNGVDNDSIGTWAPFPEANIPQWGTDNTTDPELFRRNFSAASAAIKGKDAFPGAKTSVLLNSTTYVNSDWGQPSKSASAMLPYVQGVGADELCFQGFPWGNDTTDPSQFLNAQVATTVAASMGGPGKVSVRLNTGTYSKQTNPDQQGKIDTMTDQQRAATLQGELQAAKALKTDGYDVTLQVFAQNKFPDEADWSYPAGSAAEQALTSTLKQASDAGISTSVFA